ncbi:MAG: glycosyltransferase family 4 protein [Acidocella sp.]|uniref:glycosyltransferase family 4 protein n=1 Tax=Acidocella sp. TaxID=50710 RepID=UPI003FD83E1D
MRILHLVNHCGKANGHVNVSVDMACTQSRNGHVVGYTCSKGDFIPMLEQAGVKVFKVEEPHRNIRQFIKAHFELWRAIMAFQPDIIHVHMAAQSVLIQPYRLMGYKVVTTVHNEFDRSVWLMGLASRIVTVSKAGYAGMIRRGFSSKKIRIVLNGSVGSPRLKQDFSPAQIQQPAIITVAGMHPRKGISDLLHAFWLVTATHPSAHLYLLGEGPRQKEYEALAAELNLTDSAHFLGFRDDPREHLFAADIFVLASHSDPGPLVIAEARNAGCAIVATNVDGIPEMLDHGAAGILVPPKEPATLAAAIVRLLADRAELEKYSKMARKNVDRFTISRVCREMDQIYRELV